MMNFYLEENPRSAAAFENEYTPMTVKSARGNILIGGITLDALI